MTKRKVKAIQGKRIQYRLNHPLIGNNLHFDSWMTLCEHVVEVAEEEAQRRLNDSFMNLMTAISDEIIATAEEYEPETTD